MSKSNTNSTKLESSVSAMPVGRMASKQHEGPTNISSSVSNITRTTERGTTKRKAINEVTMTKDERYLGGSSLIYVEEEGTSQEEETASILRLGSTNDEHEQQKAEEKGVSKCFGDWKEFYLQIFGNLKSKSDLVIAFTHYILTKNGFRCLGLGDDKTYAENASGSINLPEGWNNFPKYAIRYIYNRMLHILLAVHLEHRLVINLLNTRTNVVTNITVFPEITVRSTSSGQIDKLIPNPEKLAQSLYSNLIQTFTDTKTCVCRKFLQLGSSDQGRKGWEELGVGQTTGKSLPINNVVEEVKRQNVKDQCFEMQNSPLKDAQIQDGTEEPAKRRRTSSTSNEKLPKRTSEADQKPQTARANNNSSNNTKRMKALKKSIDEAVPTIKDAILCYVDAMVNNWVEIYGKEIMKSGKMAIRNLAEQREIIEKYMELAEPVKEPKGSFVIYNSKITLNENKERQLRENIEQDLRKWKEETIRRNVYDESTKPFTEVNNESPIKLAEPKKELIQKVESGKQPSQVSRLYNRGRTKNQKNLKNMEAKICEDEKDKKGLESKSKTSLQNCKTKPIEIPQQKYVKHKSPRKASKKFKSITSNIEPSFKASNLKNTNKKFSTTQVKCVASNPFKNMRFDLPKKLRATPTYLSNIQPSTYKNFKNLLKTSLPFSVQERHSGGYEQLNLPLENYEQEQNQIPPVTQQKIYDDDEALDFAETRENNADFSMQSIEEHFAKQIEAKRLELLEMVRRRDLQNIMQRNEERKELHKMFIQPNMENEKDVGSFVPPVDDWSLWQFKLKLSELREREAFASSNKKITFKN
ncbi:DNA ligase 1-like [Eurosta solidaginis]|uniref:DNA ligase 1-like n=1 Tax=Eurosta solidaginis TaxID=178769 RepID=UPI00353143D1